MQLLGFDVDHYFIRRVENGERFVTDIDLVIFARALDVSINDILSVEDAKLKKRKRADLKFQVCPFLVLLKLFRFVKIKVFDIDINPCYGGACHCLNFLFNILLNRLGNLTHFCV